MKSGKILWIDQRDGNGIIKDKQDNEYYFDTSVFKDFTNAKRDNKVKFNTNEDIKDCLCARDVVIVL